MRKDVMDSFFTTFTFLLWRVIPPSENNKTDNGGKYQYGQK